MKWILGLASLLFFASAVSANTTAPVTGQITWTGTGVGKAHTGTLKLKSGELQLKGKQVVGGKFVFDMNSIDYKNPRLVGHLKSPDFFEVEKFSEATFVATKVEALAKPVVGAPNHKITGDLTIRGTTAPISFDAIVTENGKTLTAKGDIIIPDRTVYGVKYNSKKFFDVAKLGDKLIEDQIKISLDVAATLK
ncbi:MAG: YceI family protein [Proteobacteria bacterium]|jgi:polyisoprenoid-binding protein YceI|nr:YceI family protein [Pseudomonadota bacterium]